MVITQGTKGTAVDKQGNMEEHIINNEEERKKREKEQEEKDSKEIRQKYDMTVGVLAELVRTCRIGTDSVRQRSRTEG